ncbi:MAG TPA: hypothetical protein VGM86_18680, partial [Thermoanaerobaculia bacterium]
TDPQQFYYLPNDRARVADSGKGLQLVIYTEAIDQEPDFSLSEDHAGGFLTLEVELGPSPDEVAQLRSEIASVAGGGEVHLSEVPFTDGNVTLYLLSQTGAAASGQPRGFEVSVVGSTKPSLFGRQNAVFSARLGGKAANVLYETLRKSADPQVVVTYDLQFLALRPAYNLEIEIDFKQTFHYLRQRIGVNALVASVDLDLMTQEMINTGSIVIREIDYTGKAAASSPIAGQGGILQLVKDLMSPTLFTTLPVPTPDYRALPDSATSALNTPGGTNQILSASGGGAERRPVTAGTDLALSHTTLGGGQTAGAAVPVSLTVTPAAGVTVGTAKVLYRVRGSGAAYQELAMTGGGTPGTTPPGGSTTTPPGGSTTTPPGGSTTTPPGSSTTTPPGGSTTTPPGGATTTPPGGATTTASSLVGSPTATATTPPSPAPAGGGTTTPAATTATGPFTASIPGQASGVTVEYYFRVTGQKGTASVTQTLPADQPEANPLSYTVGSSQQSGVSLKVPQTNGPLIGYSLSSIDVTQQVRRTFTLNRSEAVTQHYHPSGALGHDSIGAQFDAARQITRVALGEGPFKILVIQALAGFDFATNFIRTARVHIEYGTNPNGPGPLHAVDIVLTKDQTRGQTQFFADDSGSQAYSYFVEFTYDHERVVGASGQAIRSQTFTNQIGRSITVDLARHSPLIPVEVIAGRLNFLEGIIQQVQVRVAPTAAAEGRIIVLSPTNSRDILYVLPADPAHPVYFMRQTFFFKDESTTVERADMVDTQVVVNEPSDLIFRMIPQWVDPWNLTKEILVDASYTHLDGARERATLHLKPDTPRSEFAILLRPNDPHEWDAVPRFLMNAGEPIAASPQHYVTNEPFVGLTQSGLRVVAVELLEDPSIFSSAGLLAIKVSLGHDVTDPAQPAAALLLKASRTSGSIVVPGVAAGAPVSVAVDLLRHGLPPTHTTMTLGPAETTLYVTL